VRKMIIFIMVKMLGNQMNSI